MVKKYNQEHLALSVEHPRFTYGDLVELSQDNTIERSDHVGNLHPASLITVTDPNVRCRQVLVDSNNGDDREYRPRHIIFKTKRIPLAPNSHGTVILNNLKVKTDELHIEEARKITEHLGLESVKVGDSIAGLHLHALKSSASNSKIKTNSEIMETIPEAVNEMALYLAENSQIRRYVREDGKFVEDSNIDEKDVKHLGIYGLNDVSGSTHGILIPLSGILALDIVENAYLGTERLLHQAGSDMRRYTHDEELMGLVAKVSSIGAMAIGVNELPLYSVIDTAGLSDIVDDIFDKPISQYDAIYNRIEYGTVFTVPESSYDLPLWK
jgi:hypothetical protein